MPKLCWRPHHLCLCWLPSNFSVTLCIQPLSKCSFSFLHLLENRDEEIKGSCVVAFFMPPSFPFCLGCSQVPALKFIWYSQSCIWNEAFSFGSPKSRGKPLVNQGHQGVWGWCTRWVKGGWGSCGRESWGRCHCSLPAPKAGWRWNEARLFLEIHSERMRGNRHAFCGN